ncbi:MAG TPA: hypothetical protein VF384_13560 [Planctomycetota bacterium]
METPRCHTCAHLAPDAASCELRHLAIPDAANTSCASHPRFGRLRRPFAIGPVLHCANGTATLLQGSPDDRRTRGRLLDLIAAIDVRGTEPLSPRDAIVVWQLRELREPRAFHHLDRIDAAMVINRAREEGRLPVLGLFGAALHSVASTLPGPAPGETDAPHEFLLRFSLAGRLLLFSTVLVGVAAFGGFLLLEVELWQRAGSGQTLLHLGVGAALATLVAGLWLWAGRRVFAKLGIAFASNEAKPDAAP